MTLKMNAQKSHSDGSFCLTWKYTNTTAFKNFGIFLPSNASPYKVLFAHVFVMLFTL